MNFELIRKPRGLVVALLAALISSISTYIVVSGPRAAHAVPCGISPGNIVYAEQCVGTDGGAQIQAALTALNGQSGTVDARGITSNQVITESLTIGNGTSQAVTLQLGRGNWVLNTTTPITLSAGSTIEGEPLGRSAYSSPTVYQTNITAGNTENLSSLIQVPYVDSATHQSGAVIQDVTVNGNKDNSGTSSTGALITIQAWNVDLFRVNALNGRGNGVLLSSANQTKITKLHAGGNCASGLEINSAAGGAPSNDTFVTDSEFENDGSIAISNYTGDTVCGTSENYGAGIREDNGGATRIVHCGLDLGDFGFLQFGTGSGGDSIQNSNFGDQFGHDVSLSGGSGFNRIEDNYFQGTGHGTSHTPTYDAIQVWTSAYNTINGNTMVLNAAYQRYAGIQFVNTSGTQMVSSNTITGGSPQSNDIIAGTANIPTAILDTNITN